MVKLNVIKSSYRYTPGRIRIKIPCIYKNRNNAETLSKYIYSLEGVHLAYTNPNTGKALIFFEESVISPKELVYSTVKADYLICILGPELFDKTLSQNNVSGLLPWAQMSISQISSVLKTNPFSGLTPHDAQKRLIRFGNNSISIRQNRSFMVILASQFRQYLMQVLAAAAGISIILGEIADGFIIISIIILESFLQTLQEYKAEQALQELNKLSAAGAKVIRGGRPVEIPSYKVVPGDVLELEAGCKVPADCRIIEAHNLEIVESALTGESLPVPKAAGICNKTQIAEITNMAFMGSFVVKGRGRSIVVATGENTQMGRIGYLLSSVEEPVSPLQLELDILGKKLTGLCIGFSACIAFLGILHGQAISTMLRVGTTLAVSIIPEGLSAILAISLAFVTRRMTKENVIVRKMQALETLGKVTVICCDKTGTLTQNEMAVKQLYCGGKIYDLEEAKKQSFSAMDHPDLCQALYCGALCNNARFDISKHTVDGDPMETALLRAALQLGIDLRQVFSEYCRMNEIPFDSSTKQMTTITQRGKKTIAFVKGGVDVILKKCRYMYIEGNIVEMHEEQKRLIEEKNLEMAQKALRVLAVAYKELPHSHIDPDFLGHDLVFAGLIGMADPPRPGVKEAIQKCRQAGIHVVMITGDHPATAKAIAEELSLLDGGRVLTGIELDTLAQEELEKVIRHVNVFARTLPEHKLKIVKAFKNTGHIVAMTGDGVNDAPAIKEADIGISMGKSGTDVAREVSSLNLTDDNFVSIVRAIEEGRCVNVNIRNFIRYVLSGNLGEVIMLMLASIFGLPGPLSPGQILWINLVTEGGPALALGIDSALRPLDQKALTPVINHETISHILLKGGSFGLSGFVAFLTGLLGSGSVTKARTMAFSTLITSQMMNVYDVRKTDGPSRNPMLLPAVAMSTAMMLSIIYTPGVAGIFGTTALSLVDWLKVLALSRAGFCFSKADCFKSNSKVDDTKHH